MTQQTTAGCAVPYCQQVHHARGVCFWHWNAGLNNIYATPDPPAPAAPDIWELRVFDTQRHRESAQRLFEFNESCADDHKAAWGDGQEPRPEWRTVLAEWGDTDGLYQRVAHDWKHGDTAIAAD